MFELAWENVKANKGRLIATVVAIVTGIAFLSSGLMFTDAIRSSLGGSVQQQYPHVDAAVVPKEDRGGQTKLPASLVPKVAAVDGVKSAVADLSGPINLITPAKQKPHQLTGRLWLDTPAVSPSRVVTGHAPTAAGEIAIDRGTAKDLDLKVGESVTLKTGSGNLDAKVVGITAFGDQDAQDDDGTVSLPHDDAFKAITGGVEEYSQILVESTGDAAKTITNLESAMPVGVQVQNRDDFINSQLGDAAAFANFLQPVLVGFSLLALFICGFVIANTFGVVVAQRTRELALLRAVGATPKQVRRSVRIEALLVGFLASVLGIAVGLLLVIAATAILKAFNIELPGSGAKLSVRTVIICLAVGTLVTWFSVIRASRRAARVPPAEAMRSVALEAPTRRRSTAWLGVLAVGAAMTLIAAFTKNGYLLGLGALVAVIGLLASGPLLAKLAAQVTRRPLHALGMSGRLASDNVDRNPRRVSSTANALVIGVMLITLVTTAGGTLKRQAVDRLDQLSGTDLIVYGGATGIPPDLVTKITDTPGVAHAAAITQAPATVEGNEALVSGSNPATLQDASGFTVTQGSLRDMGDGGVAAVDITTMGAGGRRRGGGGLVPDRILHIGDPIVVEKLDGTKQTLKVEALLKFKIDAAFLGYLVTPGTFESMFGQRPVSVISIKQTDPGDTSVKKSIEKLTDDYATISVQEGNFVAQLVGTIIDVLIAGVNGLLGVSVLIALIGIVNTMTLSIIERRREIGLLRAVGMLPNEARRMIRAESIVISLFGTLVGLLAGIFLGFCLTRPIELPGASFQFEWLRLGLVAIAGLLIGLVASLVPARRVSKMDVLDALATE
jgi:putative ABC transport system permease protein